MEGPWWRDSRVLYMMPTGVDGAWWRGFLENDGPAVNGNVDPAHVRVPRITPTSGININNSICIPT